MEEEIWKDIEGYEGIYQVSSLGKIKSFRNNRYSVFKEKGKYKILKGTKSKNGYRLVTLINKFGNANYRLVHRLVAQAFIPNPLNKRDVDHINTIRSDNRASNLRWATRRENCMNPITYYRICLDRKKRAKFGRNSPTARPIYQYDKNMKLIGSYISAREASEKTGIKMSKISHAARGEQTQAGGFIWRRNKI